MVKLYQIGPNCPSIMIYGCLLCIDLNDVVIFFPTVWDEIRKECRDVK